MGVLDAKKIVQRLREGRERPEDVNALVVTPLRWTQSDGCDHDTSRPEGLDRDSIDLSLGSRFLLPRAHYLTALKLTEDDPTKYYRAVEEIHVPPGENIVIPAHGTVLGATLEYLKLPYDLSGQVLTRSSLARRFITIETAPWIHPLYRGCLTLEIANASSVPVELSPGESIAQLILFSVDISDDTAPPDSIEGTYFGPVYPEMTIRKRPRGR